MISMELLDGSFDVCSSFPQLRSYVLWPSRPCVNAVLVVVSFVVSLVMVPLFGILEELGNLVSLFLTQL